MINVEDIFRAIKKALEINFAGISVKNTDLKNHKRPSFYINIINQGDTRQDARFINSLYSFDVIYFGSSEYKGFASLEKVQADLSKLFIKPLTIIKGGRNIYFDISGLNFNVNTTDYVLNTVFNIEYIQLIPDEDMFDTNTNTEIMEELTININ